MSQKTQININEIIHRLSDAERDVVFQDNTFKRTDYRITLSSTVTVRIFCDSIINEGVSAYYFSVISSMQQDIELVVKSYLINDGLYGMSFIHNCNGRLLWIPDIASFRSYDKNGRITNSKAASFQQNDESIMFGGELSGGVGEYVEITVIEFSDNSNVYLSEIINRSYVESQAVGRYNWFLFSGMEDTWRYFIHGITYNTESPHLKVACPAQNLAYTLYFYLDYLRTLTNKNIYRILCDMIAYSLVISLPGDYCWRQGAWTDLNETHCRHQVSGIFVMLYYYRKTQNHLFLKKAELASAAVIAIQDKLSNDGLWFLHDSLELNIQSAELYYKKHRYTKAFGKTRSNTLCLNTHIWTQILLYDLCSITNNQQYALLLQKSMNTLKKVLTHKPIGFIYGPIYYMRDLLIKYSINNNSSHFAYLARKYNNFLRGRALPFLKKRFPRFIMPNGFSERDLDVTAIFDNYHLLNIKDMLMLYHRSKEEWLRTEILKVLKHLARSSHVRWVDRADSRMATMILDIYLLAAGLIDKKYVNDFSRWLEYFSKKGLPLTVDILSNPLICNTRLNRVAENLCYQFSLPSFENAKILFVNLGSRAQLLKLQACSEEESDYDVNRMGEFKNTYSGETISIDPHSWIITEIQNKSKMLDIIQDTIK